MEMRLSVFALRTGVQSCSLPICSSPLPAAFSGIVGMHPPGGLTPELDYAKPRPPAVITVGPLARSVRNAALVTQVMAGPDGRDPFSIQTEPDDFLADIAKGVKGMRFGWTDRTSAV